MCFNVPKTILDEPIPKHEICEKLELTIPALGPEAYLGQAALSSCHLAVPIRFC